MITITSMDVIPVFVDTRASLFYTRFIGKPGHARIDGTQGLSHYNNSAREL